MGKYKGQNANKGWVSIYTLVICAVVTTMIWYLAQGAERKITYVDNYISIIEKEDLNQKKKEYLMTEFNRYVEENLEKIKELGVHEYFSKNNITDKLKGIERDGLKFDDTYNIKYNKDTKVFEANVETYIYRFRPMIVEDEDDDEKDDDEVKYKFIVIT